MIERITLRQARLLGELTQEELAEKLSTTPQTISMWERGEAMPKANKFMDLCKICGVSPDMVKL